jgi:hypothetical protein
MGSQDETAAAGHQINGPGIVKPGLEQGAAKPGRRKNLAEVSIVLTDRKEAATGVEDGTSRTGAFRPEARCVEKDKLGKLMYPPHVINELDRVLYTLDRAIREGLKHGFFDYSITGEIINGNNRLVLIKLGKNHKFVIPPTDL